MVPVVRSIGGSTLSPVARPGNVNFVMMLFHTGIYGINGMFGINGWDLWEAWEAKNPL